MNQELSIADIHSDELEIVREYRLGWIVNANGGHARHVKGEGYRLDKLTTYGARTACGMCVRPKQAESIVTLTHISTGEQYVTGLDCLGKYFETNRREVRKHVKARAEIAQRVSRVTGVSSFENEESVILSVLETVRKLPRVRGIEEAQRQLEEALEQTDFRIHKLYPIIAFVLEVRDAHANPELWQCRMKALTHDPMWEETKLTIEDRNALRMIATPFDLSVETVLRMNVVRKRLLGHDPADKQRHPVVPWDYPSEAEYHSALKRYYMDRADMGDADRELMKLLPTAILMSTVKTSPLLLAVKLTASRKDIPEWALHPQLRHRLAAQLGRPQGSVHTYLSPIQHQAEYLVGKGKYKEFRSTFYRTLAVWEPHIWRDVYATWYKHRRRTPDARTFLLRPDSFSYFP